ncbi:MULTISPECIES: HU family DNA-binding protein [Rhodobacterales]|uniref:HU family DNA-binding protein n=1 Tax=Halocynthiibacter styelae TaxID=2761955 RepID=A0A8J7LQA4_9RHOB|nr:MULTISPECIES: HU family DNA-binding protein [Rhodobacterales]MBI1494846.1 HU family DNA-binding protein [Paenihalocynthiibacter styelae]
MSSSTKAPAKAKPAIVKAPATAAPAAAAQEASEDTRILKKHLIEKVARRAGVRKNEVRPILDAILEEIGDNLAEDSQMVFQPLGKIVVKQVKDIGGATVYTCKIRRSGGKTEA